MICNHSDKIQTPKVMSMDTKLCVRKERPGKKSAKTSNLGHAVL